MSFFGPPNIEKLIEKHNVRGLIDALRYREDAKVRQDAALALGGVKDDQAVTSLITALEDTDKDVRKTAILSLGQSGNSRAIAPLIRSLKDVDLRQHAADMLEKLGWQIDAGENGTLFWIAKGDWQKCVEIGSPAVKPLIATLLTEKNVQARKAILEALGKIGDIRAAKPLLSIAAKDSDEGLRNVSLNTLAVMGMPVIESLIAEFTSLDASIRQSAVSALNQIDANWKDSELAQATLHTVAITKQIRGCVFIETVDPRISSYLTDALASRVREILGRRGVLFAVEKESARTVIRLNWSKRTVGRYTSGATANKATCKIQIVDNLASDLVNSKEFESTSPPETTTYRGGEEYGDMPYADIHAYLEGLSVMPSELIPFVLPASENGVRFLETLAGEIGADPNYLNFRDRYILFSEVLEATTRGKNFKPHAMLNKVWIVQDTYQTVVEKVIQFLDKKNANYVSKEIGLFATIIADLGDQSEARMKGTIFVDPEVLPKRAIIRLIPVVKGIQTNIMFGDAFGIVYFDKTTRKRYETHFLELTEALLLSLSSSTNVIITESSSGALKNTNAVLDNIGKPPASVKKNRSMALLLEIGLGSLGLPGIGWLYSGRKKPGSILLASFLVWDLIACVLVVATSGISAVCTIPTTLMLVAISAILLNNHMKAIEKFGY